MYSVSLSPGMLKHRAAADRYGLLARGDELSSEKRKMEYILADLLKEETQEINIDSSSEEEQIEEEVLEESLDNVDRPETPPGLKLLKAHKELMAALEEQERRKGLRGALEKAMLKGVAAQKAQEVAELAVVPVVDDFLEKSGLATTAAAKKKWYERQEYVNATVHFDRQYRVKRRIGKQAPRKEDQILKLIAQHEPPLREDPFTVAGFSELFVLDDEHPHAFSRFFMKQAADDVSSMSRRSSVASTAHSVNSTFDMPEEIQKKYRSGKTVVRMHRAMCTIHENGKEVQPWVSKRICRWIIRAKQSAARLRVIGNKLSQRVVDEAKLQLIAEGLKHIVIVEENPGTKQRNLGVAVEPESMQELVDIVSGALAHGHPQLRDVVGLLGERIQALGMWKHKDIKHSGEKALALRERLSTSVILLSEANILFERIAGSDNEFMQKGDFNELLHRLFFVALDQTLNVILAELKRCDPRSLHGEELRSLLVHAHPDDASMPFAGKVWERHAGHDDDTYGLISREDFLFFIMFFVDTFWPIAPEVAAVNLTELATTVAGQLRDVGFTVASGAVTTEFKDDSFTRLRAALKYLGFSAREAVMRSRGAVKKRATGALRRFLGLQSIKEEEVDALEQVKLLVEHQIPTEKICLSLIAEVWNKEMSLATLSKKRTPGSEIRCAECGKELRCGKHVSWAPRKKELVTTTQSIPTLEFYTPDQCRSLSKAELRSQTEILRVQEGHFTDQLYLCDGCVPPLCCRLARSRLFELAHDEAELRKRKMLEDMEAMKAAANRADGLVMVDDLSELDRKRITKKMNNQSAARAAVSAMDVLSDEEEVLSGDDAASSAKSPLQKLKKARMKSTVLGVSPKAMTPKAKPKQTIEERIAEKIIGKLSGQLASEEKKARDKILAHEANDWKEILRLISKNRARIEYLKQEKAHNDQQRRDASFLNKIRKSVDKKVEEKPVEVEQKPETPEESNVETDHPMDAAEIARNARDQRRRTREAKLRERIKSMKQEDEENEQLFGRKSTMKARGSKRSKSMRRTRSSRRVSLLNPETPPANEKIAIEDAYEIQSDGSDSPDMSRRPSVNPVSKMSKRQSQRASSKYRFPADRRRSGSQDPGVTSPDLLSAASSRYQSPLGSPRASSAFDSPRHSRLASPRSSKAMRRISTKNKKANSRSHSAMDITPRRSNPTVQTHDASDYSEFDEDGGDLQQTSPRARKGRTRLLKVDANGSKDRSPRGGMTPTQRSRGKAAGRSRSKGNANSPRADRASLSPRSGNLRSPTSRPTRSPRAVDGELSPRGRDRASRRRRRQENKLSDHSESPITPARSPKSKRSSRRARAAVESPNDIHSGSSENEREVETPASDLQRVSREGDESFRRRASSRVAEIMSMRKASSIRRPTREDDAASITSGHSSGESSVSDSDASARRKSSRQGSSRMSFRRKSSVLTPDGNHRAHLRSRSESIRNTVSQGSQHGSAWVSNSSHIGSRNTSPPQHSGSDRDRFDSVSVDPQFLAEAELDFPANIPGVEVGDIIGSLFGITQADATALVSWDMEKLRTTFIHPGTLTVAKKMVVEMRNTVTFDGTVENAVRGWKEKADALRLMLVWESNTAPAMSVFLSSGKRIPGDQKVVTLATRLIQIKAIEERAVDILRKAGLDPEDCLHIRTGVVGEKLEALVRRSLPPVEATEDELSEFLLELGRTAIAMMVLGMMRDSRLALWLSRLPTCGVVDGAGKRFFPQICGSAGPAFEAAIAFDKALPPVKAGTSPEQIAQEAVAAVFTANSADLIMKGTQLFAEAVDDEDDCPMTFDDADDFEEWISEKLDDDPPTALRRIYRQVLQHTLSAGEDAPPKLAQIPFLIADLEWPSLHSPYLLPMLFDRTKGVTVEDVNSVERIARLERARWIDLLAVCKAAKKAKPSGSQTGGDHLDRERQHAQAVLLSMALQVVDPSAPERWRGHVDGCIGFAQRHVGRMHTKVTIQFTPPGNVPVSLNEDTAAADRVVRELDAARHQGAEATGVDLPGSQTVLHTKSLVDVEVVVSKKYIKLVSMKFGNKMLKWCPAERESLVRTLGCTAHSTETTVNEHADANTMGGGALPDVRRTTPGRMAARISPRAAIVPSTTTFGAAITNFHLPMIRRM